MLRRTSLQHLFLVLVFGLAAGYSFVKPQRDSRSDSLSRQAVITNQPVTTIPVEIPSYGIIFLKAQINNSDPMWFALDSGASLPFIINRSKLESLKLKADSEVEGGGGAGEGSYKVQIMRNVSVALPGIALQQQRLAAIDLSTIETLAGRRLDGLVGVSLFHKFIVEIDYAAQRVNLFDPRNYRYSGTGEVLPLIVEGNYLLVRATVELSPQTSVSGKFLLDTGGGLVTAVLTTPFVKSENVRAHLKKTIQDDSLSALGGDIKVHVGRPFALKLGTHTISQPILYLSQNNSGALASADYDGVIGAEVLKRFRVIFDYSRRQLILERNAHFADASEYNKTGISVRATGDSFKVFTVYQVMTDSPGFEVGVRKGDVIVQINERPAAEFVLDDIYRLFKESTGVIRLTLTRGREIVKANIKPRLLI